MKIILSLIIFVACSVSANCNYLQSPHENDVFKSVINVNSNCSEIKNDAVELTSLTGLPENKSKDPYRLTFATKAIITTACVSIGAAVVSFYGPPLLYYIGYTFAEYMIPTTGFSYYYCGFPIYHNAGIVCSTSTVSKTVLTTAASTVGGLIGSLAVNATEYFLNLGKNHQECAPL